MADKTMVDVADKALDKLSGGIEAVARAVENAAPHVWEVLVRQARWEGVAGAALSASALLVAAVALVWLKRSYPGWKAARQRLEKGRYSALYTNVKAEDIDVEPFGHVMLAVVATMVVAFATGSLAFSALKIANPEYYAAKQLIEATK